MRVCVHRGTLEIGGTCIEIESQGSRLVLDVGLPLDADDPDQVALPPVEGFHDASDSLLGVVISHAHPDHYGLANRLPKQTPVLMGEASQRILSAAADFTPGGGVFESVIHLEDREVIELGPFTITPYLVDHSAYDAYAIMIESNGKRLFYSGDIRTHGRKAKLMDRLISDPPNVDVLLMEGTTLGRADTDKGFPTETEIEGKMVELIQETKGMVLVWASGQNIDRLVTIFRACKRNDRQFIVDMYTAHILRATGNERLPQAEWDDVKVFLPKSQKYRVIKQKMFDLANSFRNERIFPEALKEAAPRSAMLFRPSMIRDLEAADCLDDAQLIYSLWPGYLKDELRFTKWLEERGISLHHCHTSGHASAKDLLRFRDAFADAPVVPVHLDRPDRFCDLFSNVQVHRDGEWWKA